jgi:Secretion system C-terminal sorting domain
MILFMDILCGQKNNKNLHMKNIITAWLLVFCYLCHAQTVTQVEYAYDVDLGVAKNNIIAVSPQQSDINFGFTIPSAGLTPGYHKLYLRTKNSDGHWSHTSMRLVEVPFTSSLYIINRGEYFFDVDPGFGNATPITISTQQDMILQNFTAATASLTPGYHKLYIRVRDGLGNWTHTLLRNVDIMNTLSIGAVERIEYFLNTDPGVGKANSTIVSNPQSDGSFSITIPQNQLQNGLDTLCFRVKDNGEKNWSLTQWKIQVITITTSLFDLQLSKDIQTYPVPITHNLILNNQTNSPVTVELYDINGRQITSWKSVTNTQSLSFMMLPSGTYMLKVTDEKTKKMFTRKIMKQ